MALLNYTTTIDANKTIMEIQKILGEHGATGILTEFDDNGYIVSISFKILVDGKPIGFKLPTNWQPVQRVLEEQRKRRYMKTDQEQALRVAWRITKDWIEAQMAMIETQMATIQQVFLPYAVTNDGSTVYEKFESNSNLLLGGGSDD